MNRHTITSLCTALLAISCLPANAGGPLLITGGTPVRYQDPAITINVEGGDLGVLSNTAAVSLVEDAFSLWTDVATSSLNLQTDTSAINVDVDISNFESYLPSVDDSVKHIDDGINPLVFDDSGEIIDAYFGIGQSDTLVGLALSYPTADQQSFREGYAIINGRTDIPGITNTLLRVLITHEIGHFFGLDHTQTDIDNRESVSGLSRFCQTAPQLDDYAVMYPIICRESATLHEDDISALSALYPGDNINQVYGIIQGRVVEVDGTPVLGANIWAENVSTGVAISIISDYLVQNNGFYKLYLPAGNYTLHANSLNTSFVDASRIGPYSLTLFDASFQDPHPIGEVDYLGPTGDEAEVLTVSAGQTVDVSFDLDGRFVEGSTLSPGDDGGGLSDMFGGISPLTSLLLAVMLSGIRLIKRHKATHQ